MERVLAFGCHPDDIEFSAAGTLALLAAHESQRDWLRYINKWDAYIENMKEGSVREGKRIGRPMGECFLQHRGMGYPADNILKKILGDLCVELFDREA